LSCNQNFVVDFFKKLHLIIIGVIKLNQSFLKFDYFLITNYDENLLKFLFFSFIYNLYRISWQLKQSIKIKTITKNML
jgi:hypothetical protein